MGPRTSFSVGKGYPAPVRKSNNDWTRCISSCWSSQDDGALETQCHPAGFPSWKVPPALKLGILGRATSHLPTWGEATCCNEHKFSTLLDILSYFVDFYRCVGCVIFIFTGAAAFEAGSAGSNPTTTTPTYQVVQNHWPLQLNSCSQETNRHALAPNGHIAPM